MEPGDRVTMKNDRRTHYGTVIPGQLRNNDGLTFVVWDRFPNRFHFYGCGELRLLRENEEVDSPEGTLETTEDFIVAAKSALAKIYSDDDGNLHFPID